MTTDRTIATTGPEPFVTTAPAPGEPHRRLGERGSLHEHANGAPIVLGTLWHLTDLHVTDPSSPIRAPFLNHLGEPNGPLRTRIGRVGTYRPHEAASAHVLAAMVRQLGSITRAPVFGGAVDLVVASGDLADNAQANEVAAASALLSGREGTLRAPGLADPFEGPGGLDDDPHYWHPEGEPFDEWRTRRGFPQIEGWWSALAAPIPLATHDLPVLFVAGNHDLLLQGTVPASPRLARAAMGARTHWRRSRPRSRARPRRPRADGTGPLATRGRGSTPLRRSARRARTTRRHHERLPLASQDRRRRAPSAGTRHDQPVGWLARLARRGVGSLARRRTRQRPRTTARRRRPLGTRRRLRRRGRARHASSDRDSGQHDRPRGGAATSRRIVPRCAAGSLPERHRLAGRAHPPTPGTVGAIEARPLRDAPRDDGVTHRLAPARQDHRGGLRPSSAAPRRRDDGRRPRWCRRHTSVDTGFDHRDRRDRPHARRERPRAPRRARTTRTRYPERP